MKIDIVATGSTGNSFIINDEIIIDLGVSIKLLDERIDLKKVTHILLTHEHGDHFNRATIRTINIKHPHITFVFTSGLSERIRLLGVNNTKELERNTLYKIGDYRIATVELYHDVPNVGYRIVHESKKLIYMTDTMTVEGITAFNYDYGLIECNHGENKALELISKAKENDEFTHLKRAMATHLSVQQTVAFVKENNIKRLIPIHIGDSTRKEVMEYLNENNILCA